MRERPILFSGPMVREIFADQKTQTRRVVGLDTLRPSTTSGYDWTFRGKAPVRSIAQQKRAAGGCWQDLTAGQFLALCPYGQPGDRLWVRETWGLHGRGDYTWWCRDSIKGRTADDLALSYEVAYAADATSEYDHWRPSIHMPRWASRLTLEVTSVRVERLQDITEDDARAEGCGATVCDAPDDSRTLFRDLWESINGPESWEANPFVWCIKFRRLA